MSLVTDASSMIYAWDNYPEPQFPALWVWIGDQFKSGEVVIPTVAFEEVGHKTPDCELWLTKVGINPSLIDNQIIREALRIKSLLGVSGDQYSAKGVDENDLFIIATAKIKGRELVSEEARQNNTPQIMANMKIPAVCALPSVMVPCINFVELIKRSKVVFK